MQLADAWIHGMRRFGGGTPHRLRLDAKLVCLIGANEVGKSTLLAALENARHGGAVGAPDRSRRENVPDDRNIVRLRYRLQAADHEALATLDTEDDPREIRWFDVFIRADGQRTISVERNLRRVGVRADRPSSG